MGQLRTSVGQLSVVGCPWLARSSPVLGVQLRDLPPSLLDNGQPLKYPRSVIGPIYVWRWRKGSSTEVRPSSDRAPTELRPSSDRGRRREEWRRKKYLKNGGSSVERERWHRRKRSEMRGNWEAAEAPVLAPSQQQQQRQQQRQRQQREQQQQQEENIMEERGLPLRSPTTPAWNDITDGRVKEEPVEHPEDGNNDSGVSPGHYTSNSASPRSRRSSSTVNCSLSPGSATSQDSNAMQCTNFDYSPRSIYKNCDSTLDYGGTNDESNENRHSPMDVVSMSVKSGCRESEVIAQDTLRCPVCSFATFDRIEFTEHLAAHRASTSRETPDFTKSLLNPREKDGIREHHREIRETIDGTRNTEEAADGGSHPGDDRSEQESEEADEPGLRVPRVNSQGKVKKFRCKQCNFVAVTKFEFWEHSRGHIKAEKLLACPKCPFVTEYKHHLEYHLRNHFGSKPFKCDKCSYSCVNKSMLNSHSKSHSNVYQYRCANCSYATKYCHSLKLHLRKYSHRPAMVLNADGSPNPLPIIDVYGTRRGPKQKPSNPGVETREDDNSQLTNVGSPSPARASQLSPLDPMRAMHALADSVNRGLMNFPYNRLFAAFPLGNRYPLNEEATEKRSEQPKTNILVEYARAMAASDQRMIVDYPNEAGGANGFDASEENSGKLNDLESMSKESIDARRESIVVEAKTPLDLSKPDSLVNNNNSSNANNNTRVERISSNVLGSGGNSGKTTGTSRRKGRAVKLDRRVVEEESDEREEKDDDGRGTRVVGEINRTNLDNSKDDSSDKHFGGVATSNEFACQYCQIAFGNVVMYTVHMGYHGYKDPYTCNMCGHECDDKVSFFLHIARSKHS